MPYNKFMQTDTYPAQETKTYTLLLGDTKINITVDATFNTYPAAQTDLIDSLKKLHAHSNYEIFFVSGKNLCITTAAGTMQVADSAAIVPPFFYHFSESGGDAVTRFTFSLAKRKNKKPALFAEILKHIGTNFISAFPLTDELRDLISQLNRAFRRTGELSGLKIQCLLTMLMLSVFDQFFISRNVVYLANLDKTDNYVTIIEGFIQNNYSKKIGIGKLAESLHLSVRQTARILKQQYGRTFSELINDKKLSIACALLQNTPLKISEIAWQTGFETESYFFVLFKKKYGVTPLAYRKQLSNG